MPDNQQPEILSNPRRKNKKFVLIILVLILVTGLISVAFLLLKSNRNFLNSDATKLKSGTQSAKISTSSSDKINQSTESSQKKESNRQFSNSTVSFVYPGDWELRQRNIAGTSLEEILVSPDFNGDPSSLKVTKGSLILFTERNAEIFDKNKTFFEAVKAFYLVPQRSTEKDTFVSTKVGGKEAVRWDSYLGYKDKQPTITEVKSSPVKTIYFVNLGINSFTSNVAFYTFGRYYPPGEQKKYEKEFLHLIESVEFN